MVARKSNSVSLVQVKVDGLPSSIRTLVDKHIEKLQDHYGKLMGGRIAIRTPGSHHKMGEPYTVSIHLNLPNRREVNVGRVSDNRDPRHADLAFVIDDAFRRANIQLSRQAEKLEGEVKHHNPSPTGRIIKLDNGRDCGVLASQDNREIYFHAHSVLGGQFEKLAVGDRVTYHEEMGRQGPQASMVRLLGRRHRV